MSLAAVVAYVLLINFLGFYLATALFLIGLLLMLVCIAILLSLRRTIRRRRKKRMRKEQAQTK